ncbi:MAG TPA: lipase maturation factor family protein, partial [Anaeromyxobacter sp.]
MPSSTFSRSRSACCSWTTASSSACAAGSGSGAPPRLPRRIRAWPRAVPAAAAILTVPLSFLEVTGSMREAAPPAPFVRIASAVSPFRIVNGYGLFAVMTTRRPEIVVEGSRDGTVWTPYEFRWKPGDPLRRPQFVAPHQPRLDWQMWFAA